MRVIRGLGKLAWFELIWKALILGIVSPLFRDLYQGYIASVGVSFNGGVFSALLSPKGALLFAALFLASAGLIFFELTVTLQILERARRGEALSLPRVLGRAVWGLGTLRGWGAVPAALYYVLLLPLVQVGYVNSMVPAVTIPWFIFGELQKSTIGQVGMVAIYVVCALLFLLLLFVPVAMGLEHRRFFPAVRRSLGWWRDLGWRAWLALLAGSGAWVWAFSELARYWRRSVLENTDFDGYFFRYLLYSEAFRKDLLYWAAVTALQIVCMALFLYGALSLLSARGLLRPALDPRWGEDARTVLPVLSRRARAVRDGWRRRWGTRRWRAGAAAVCLALAVYVVLGCFPPPPARQTPQVVGHRGCIHAVENSLEAIRLAGELGADYAEIDVQLSADGVPVVIHDDSLWRLAGELTQVSDLTWAELQTLTIRADTTQGLGRTASIPSLEDVILAVQGSGGMGLLIELKPAAGRGQALVEAVTELVERYDFAGQAMFMSLDYPSVEALHAAHPEWRVGYCVFGAAGDLDESVWRYDIDFLAAEESMISNRFVMQAREQGLPLYVWSVYDTEKMTQYLEMGVSGIITDWPEEARAVTDRYLAGHDPEAFSDRAA